MHTQSPIDPTTSATVSASAGTGKTWSLVSRVIRLLIDGADPGGILAITFTRKAAAEMQARLNERLLGLASCETGALKQQLELIGAPVSESTMNVARQLYEKILYSNYPPRITTFHAMCQELLKRFPFDANVPPGFELVELTTDLENEAADLLFTEATLSNEGPIAKALEHLFHYGNGIANTRLALENFLKHRSDWWAFTNGQKDPVSYAINNLKRQLGIENSDDEPEASFFKPEISAQLTEFSELLAKNPTATNMGFCEAIDNLFQQVDIENYLVAFSQLTKVFFTGSGDPIKRKSTGTQKKKMGDLGDQRFLELHAYFVEKITAIKNMRAKLNTFQVSSAWFVAGHQLLQHFQTIKKDQRILDFSDLEWSAYLLLSSENHAAWVQYKLDSRISHVLIDEYQDTNPTQWHLLKPLLDEICSSKSEINRSIFLVGDTKQSIYRFRRAQPELFSIAQNWMNENLDCVKTSLDMSRRSAPAIIDFVNTVYKDGALRDDIVDFEPHGTHLENLWGKVTVLPLFTGNEDAPENEEPEHDREFRNPLLAPSVKDEEQRRVNEARFIAEEIRTLISAPTIVGEGNSTRYLKYSDIIILMRQRTHAGIYEKALNAENIPYVGISKGTLLDTLEIKDLSALLNTLITPFDNLALAQVLKSPIFGCSDQELLLLAAIKKSHWFDRLLHLSANNPELTTVMRAVGLLSNWKQAAGKLPVHDLLDKIISESNLINRYIAAYPPHLKLSVESNLNRFVELALEIDSGRYPSIARFLHRLALLRDNQNDAPDELPAGKHTDRVRLMTIHSAKGLEAPVIFLVDAANTPSGKDAYHAVVDWPAEASKPGHFLMALKKGDQDQTVQEIFSNHQKEIQRENANLLYVALTRARQLLYVTGSQPKKNAGKTWYDAICTQLEKHAEEVNCIENGSFVFTSHQMPSSATPEPETPKEHRIDIATALSKPLPLIETETAISPSSLNRNKPQEFEYTQTGNTDGRLRGIIIHKILQLMTESVDIKICRKQVDALFAGEASPNLIEQCWVEAQTLIENDKFKHLFDERCFDKAYNEVPLQYSHRNFKLHGIIDRLVVSGNTVYVVDYKTALRSEQMPPEESTSSFSAQMSVYYHGIRKLWPDKSVKAQVLQTAHQSIMDIETLDLDGLISGMGAAQNT
jgi:ATP-dependent helicase/nuclease subunit A